jgi:hypothetical protein
MAKINTNCHVLTVQGFSFIETLGIRVGFCQELFNLGIGEPEKGY